MKNINRSWYVYVATLGPLGFLKAPGTVASIVTTLCYVPFSYAGYTSNLLFLTIFSLSGFWVITCALPYFNGEADPSVIVLDEVVGMLWATLFIAPGSGFSLIGALILFRVFDISKIAGIHRIEKFSQAWGIIGDDIAAGFLSAIVTWLIMSVIER